MQKLFLSLGLSLTVVSLVACKQKPQTKQAPDPSELKTELILKDKTAPHQDIRLKFNEIKLASSKDDFKGGTSLEELKTYFGEPSKHETVPAGEVSLDLYTWKFEQVELNVHLFENNAIVRTISNFRFNREQTVTKSVVDALKLTNGDQKGDSFKAISEKLGQPDSISQAVSSDKEEIEAVWTSGLKTDSGATLKLYFENDALVNIEQTGITN